MYNPFNRDPIVIDSESDDDSMHLDFATHQARQRGIDFRYDSTTTSPQAQITRPPHSGPGSIPGPNQIPGPGPAVSLSPYHPPLEQEKRVRSRLREDRHAALCVLMDRELLSIQALAAQETLPQTRRRFLAKLIAPNDSEAAAAIRADRFTIQHQSGGGRASSSPSSSAAAAASTTTTPMTVHRRIENVDEDDDAGWRRPEAGGGGGGSGSSAVSSPASSSAAARKGKMTPERSRRGQPLSERQRRERERRRRREEALRAEGGA